ncbi:DMT family transporter [Alcaligenes phenolicus]
MSDLVAPVLLMIAATSLWALAFVAPAMVPRAGALDIALGRYLAYGVFSVLMLTKTKISKFTLREAMLALSFAAFGNVVYYMVLLIGIGKSGAAVAVPIIGLLPVTISISGGLRQKNTLRLALTLPILCVLVGVLLVYLPNFHKIGDEGTNSLSGIALLLLSVAMWTWYAIANSSFLKRRPDVSASEWASVTGVATLPLSIGIISVLTMFGIAEHSMQTLASEGQIWSFALSSLVLGVGASWGAAVLFNRAAAKLPPVLSGQLIIFETIFGGLYVFLSEGRKPELIETVGFAVAIFGILMSIRALQRA